MQIYDAIRLIIKTVVHIWAVVGRPITSSTSLRMTLPTLIYSQAQLASWKAQTSSAFNPTPLDKGEWNHLENMQAMFQNSLVSCLLWNEYDNLLQLHNSKSWLNQYYETSETDLLAS